MTQPSDSLCLQTINAPYSRLRSIKLADRESIVVRVSLTHPDKWINSIYENSCYGTFIWHTHEQKMELVSSGMKMLSFRKQKAKTLDECVAKINKYLAKHNFA